MLLRYLMDRKSWIIFYLLSLSFVDLLIWIDNGIAVQAVSLLYLNVLLILALVIFLGWRFHVEMQYSRALADLTVTMDDDWMIALPTPQYHHEEAANQLLRTAGQWTLRRLSEVQAVQAVEKDYVASWVHEVKAPLTAMKLTIDAERGNPVMRKMELDWLRMHLLIDQQLYISRLPSLEADYVLEQTGIQQLAAMEVRELASWCVEKNIAVEFEGEEVIATTDRKWCRFILRQLLTNAVKYSPEGGMIVLSTDMTPQGHVRLTVRDEGAGIAAHDLPRIFDRGFTGENGRMQNAATGLGLYLAQTIALKIGISLGATSELHAGTEMEMIFHTVNTFERRGHLVGGEPDDAAQNRASSTTSS
ncbi:sensor histidine kinase [Paenibacillus guangzhouensis]|uniref:sensor histidine kinase n=1 Tax=Paenibacillus guangzhouensis TaxID=1473112 RepID=UPI001D119CCB|nr:sensor histidine kinase [Paenibacillus guangzhouensis]